MSGVDNMFPDQLFSMDVKAVRTEGFLLLEWDHSETQAETSICQKTRSTVDPKSITTTS